MCNLISVAYTRAGLLEMEGRRAMRAGPVDNMTISGGNNSGGNNSGGTSSG